jgi:hypothetical protein
VSVAALLPKRCSYWADIPSESLPDGVEPLRVAVSIGGKP